MSDYEHNDLLAAVRTPEFQMFVQENMRREEEKRRKYEHDRIRRDISTISDRYIKRQLRRAGVEIFPDGLMVIERMRIGFQRELKPKK